MPEGIMIDRLLGIIVGGVVTLLLLLLFHNGLIISNETNGYIVAVLAGAVCNFFWPIIIAWRVSRRAKQRQQESVQAEVQRQVASQQTQNREP
jgi:hypothetical protein